MRYDLDSYEQAQALMKNLWPKVREALVYGKKLTIEIKAQSRSDEQNRKYHAIFSDIARQAEHCGSKWDAEDWKRMLVWQYCKEKQIEAGKVVPSLDMTGIVQLGQQTRKFTKEQASEFVEFLLAWCADNGIELNEKTM
jgi:excinuclease UvrABC ATPase subunit